MTGSATVEIELRGNRLALLRVAGCALLLDTTMDPKHQAIIDAAMEVAVFSSTHTWPTENSPEYFEFAEKLNRLGSMLNAAYPAFRRNVAASVRYHNDPDGAREDREGL